MDALRFSKMREQSGHTQKSLAEKLGVSPSTVSMWERGGWITDQTMKSVYQNVFSAERLQFDERINEYFENIVCPHDSPHA